MPPSVNGYLYGKIIRVGGRPIARLAETEESKVYKSKITPIIRKAMIEQSWETPEKNS